MIYFKISYYHGKDLLGGHFLEEKQLKFVKKYADPYVQLYKKINVRIESAYCPDSIKADLNIQEIEVF